MCSCEGAAQWGRSGASGTPTRSSEVQSSARREGGSKRNRDVWVLSVSLGTLGGGDYVSNEELPPGSHAHGGPISIHLSSFPFPAPLFHVHPGGRLRCTHREIQKLSHRPSGAPLLSPDPAGARGPGPAPLLTADTSTWTLGIK